VKLILKAEVKMKTVKTKLIAVFIFGFILCNTGYSQNTVNTSSTNNRDGYSNAIGIRVGETSGLTVKHFFGSNSAFEGILSTWPNTFGVTGLYEKYAPVGTVKNLNWYYGGGAHVTFGTNRPYYTYYNEGNRYAVYRSNYPGIGLGIDGIIGLEYKIPRAPIAISMDLKPFIELNNAGVLFTALDPSFGIKVAF
jgi:hypothetical protein